MRIHVGLPYTGISAMSMAASAEAAPVLFSAGSMFRKEEGLSRLGMAPWSACSVIDSGGFVAMKMFGGYRWTVEEYVDAVVTNCWRGHLPFPWKWWAAMDLCCEPEIAKDRKEVIARVEGTARLYEETLEHLDWWRGEGDTETPDPMPVLQGWKPEDYLLSVSLLEAVRAANGREPLPRLVGVGSVCRRDIHGEDGLLNILDMLDLELPDHVELHLFGVKGVALKHLGALADRVASIDSEAWDYAARRARGAERRRYQQLEGCTIQEATKALPMKNTYRAGFLRRWYRNLKRL